MMEITSKDPILQNLHMSNVQDYLLFQGWSLKKQPNEQLVIFEGASDTTGKPIELALPASEKSRGYLSQLAETINLIAFLNDVPASDIADQMLTRVHGCDRLVIRIVDPGGGNSLPFEPAVELMTAIYRFIGFAAQLEARRDKRPYFKRLSETGMHFVRRCRLGHTVRGSFGITIESPITRDNMMPGVGTPFERRVMERIARGLGHIIEAT